MKHSDLVEENNRYATAFTLTDLCTQLTQQGLHITPLDVGAGGTSEQQLKRALVLALHAD